MTIYQPAMNVQFKWEVLYGNSKTILEGLIVYTPPNLFRPHDGPRTSPCKKDDRKLVCNIYGVLRERKYWNHLWPGRGSLPYCSADWTFFCRDGRDRGPAQLYRNGNIKNDKITMIMAGNTFIRGNAYVTTKGVRLYLIMETQRMSSEDTQGVMDGTASKI